jgi:hypothetical protein
VVILGLYLFLSPVFINFKSVHRGTSSPEETTEVLYAKYLSWGDEFMNKGEWYNAAFEYRNAKKIIPDRYEIRYRLARAALEECKASGRTCEEAHGELNYLLTHYPDRIEVEALQLQWDMIRENQRSVKRQAPFSNSR